jgi:hypothetical protein
VSEKNYDQLLGAALFEQNCFSSGRRGEILHFVDCVLISVLYDSAFEGD